MGYGDTITGKVVRVEPIDTDAFEDLVADALESIPDELRAEMTTLRSSSMTRVHLVGSSDSTRGFR